MMRSRVWWLPATVAVASRPRLWATAVRQLLAFSPRRPPSPGRLPSARPWWRFRMETAYGDPAAQPEVGDVVAFLEWCRETRFRRRPMR